VSRRRQAGFTLVEVIIALAIVGTLLLVAFGGLRVALAAWRQAEDRVDAHDHVRGVAVTLTRALGAIYPYKGALSDAPDSVVLFIGQGDRLQFVTQTPPSSFALPIAFTAVVVGLESDDEHGQGPGLVIRERALPNREPFTKATVVYRDPDITAIELGYLDDTGAWRDEWDAQKNNAMPSAVRLTLGTKVGGRTRPLTSITVPVRVALPQ